MSGTICNNYGHANTCAHLHVIVPTHAEHAAEHTLEELLLLLLRVWPLSLWRGAADTVDTCSLTPGRGAERIEVEPSACGREEREGA